MESTLTPEQHALLRNVLAAQTESYGTVELPAVVGLLRAHRCRTVLDIGCGDASFLARLAAKAGRVRFVGIDHSALAIADARARVRQLARPNVTLRTGFFDERFPRTKYDAIVTRYTLQHSSHPQAFARAAFDRIARRGVFIALESLDAYTDCHRPEPVWDRFKGAIAEVHRRVGSDANVGKSLGLLLRGAGFTDIRVQVMLCAPSIVGWERFRAVVLTSAELASAFFPDLFDARLREDVERWLEDRAAIEAADPYLCSAIASGVKP